MKIILLACLLIIVCMQSLSPTLRVANPEILDGNQDLSIMNDGVLNSEYDDSTFNEALSCRNGNLNIIAVSKGDTLIVSYQGLGAITMDDIRIAASPNNQPLPSMADLN